jgi:hypothetical protein
MATPSFDLSGLVLLENTIASMLATQTATPSTFTGAQPFNATYISAPSGAPASMTTAQLRDRVRALHLNIDRLSL